MLRFLSRVAAVPLPKLQRRHEATLRARPRYVQMGAALRNVRSQRDLRNATCDALMRCSSRIPIVRHLGTRLLIINGIASAIMSVEIKADSLACAKTFLLECASTFVQRESRQAVHVVLLTTLYA